MAKPAPKTLTRVQLAIALGVNPRTVAKWLEEGMPIASRGRGGRPSRYDEQACRAWVEARNAADAGKGGDFAASRARKELAQAIEAEQRVAIKAGRLIPVDVVDETWSRAVAALRARLLSLPTALADRLCRIAATEGAAGIEAALETAVHEALRELASGSTDTKPAPVKKARPKRKKRRGNAAWRGKAGPGRARPGAARQG